MIYVIRQYDGWSSGATPKAVAFGLSKEAADDYCQMRNYQGAGQFEYEYSTERVLNDEDDKLRVELGILHKAVDDLTSACADTGDVMQRLRAENEHMREKMSCGHEWRYEFKPDVEPDHTPPYCSLCELERCKDDLMSDGGF